MTDPTDPKKKKKKAKVVKNTKHVNLDGVKISKRTGKVVPKGTNKKQRESKSGLTEKLAREEKRRGKDSPRYKELLKREKKLDRSVIIQGGRQEDKSRVANKLRNQPNSSEIKSVNKRRSSRKYNTTK